MSDDERLTLALTETDDGGWYFAVYAGDGSALGSLKRAASSFSTLAGAYEAGSAALIQCVQRRTAALSGAKS